MLLDELFESWIRAQISVEIGGTGEPSITPTTTIIEQSTQTLDRIFSPDFTCQSIDSTPLPSNQIASDTPLVTIVEESKDLSLSVATKFFFPHDRSDTPAPKSNLPTAIDSSSNNNFVLPSEPESITPAINEAWSRSTKLAIAILLLITIIIGSIALKQSTSKQYRTPLHSTHAIKVRKTAHKSIEICLALNL